ncbi:TIR domain-containing protein [Nonomuraea salmonea]|uniref:TIR domain-containing protein n=1 Tax=Nonomuraea salmonea TaxID=46181 RepID=UPI003CD08156
MSAYVAGCPESSRHLRETRCVLWVFYTGLVALSPDSGYAYDVCLSYAGEQRAYVELVAAGLRRAGVRVFFDAYEQATLWGKDLYEHLSHIYQEAAQYCVLFLHRLSMRPKYGHRTNVETRKREPLMPMRSISFLPGLMIRKFPDYRLPLLILICAALRPKIWWVLF